MTFKNQLRAVAAVISGVSLGLYADTAHAQEGLRGEYFNNVNLAGTPVVRIDPQVNFDWQQGSPITNVGPERFSVRWTGQVVPLHSELYTFYTVSDDGVRLWVNGERIINNWTPHLPTTDTGSTLLKAGRPYTIQFEFFDLTVDALVSLSWSSLSQSYQIVPQSQLRLPIPGQNRPPNTPILISPSTDNVTIDAANPLLRTEPFTDPDTGNFHQATEWEIWTANGSERIWYAARTNGVNLLTVQLAEGVFENSHTNRTSLTLRGEYVLRSRHSDDSGDTETKWSNWVERRINTARPLFTIIQPGAAWRYRDNSFDQGALWRDTNFSDSFWAVGNAQFGFGDGDEVTTTCCSSGPRPITTYFRHTFVLTNAPLITNLTGYLLRDDGGVVYLNGVEVFRSNLDPTATISYSTLAANASAADELYFFHPFNIPVTRLRQGTNVVAVEIHQSSATSSDLSFDFELVAEITTIPSPLSIVREGSGCILVLWDDGDVVLEQSIGANGPWSSVSPPVESPYRICDIKQSNFYRLRRR